MKCGSCKNFIKFKNDKYSSGICEIYDVRVNTDTVKYKCKFSKSIPYKRKKV